MRHGARKLSCLSGLRISCLTRVPRRAAGASEEEEAEEAEVEEEEPEPAAADEPDMPLALPGLTSPVDLALLERWRASFVGTRLSAAATDGFVLCQVRRAACPAACCIVRCVP